MSTITSSQIELVRCVQCGNLRLPHELDPWLDEGSDVCPRCLSSDLTTEAVEGDATVLTFAWYLLPFSEHLDELPYAMAYIELDAGPFLYARVGEVEHGELEIGQRLRATRVTGPNGEPNVLRFVPAD